MGWGWHTSIQSVTEVPDSNEGNVSGNGGRGDPRYSVAEDLAELCTIGRKVELTSNELGYLNEEIPKQSVESAAWFLLTACSKTQEEKNKLEKEPLSQKNS